MFSLFNLVLVLIFAIVFIAIGAYSHKYLAKITGAPSNIRSTQDAADALKTAASKAAHAAVDEAHAVAKAGVEKILS